MEFDVASVRLDTFGDFTPSIAMSSDDGFSCNRVMACFFHTEVLSASTLTHFEFASYKISLAP